MNADWHTMTPAFDRKHQSLLASVLALALLAIASCSSAPQRTPSLPPTATPAQIYGQLFVDVQMASVFPDSKTFVDAMPNRAPQAILAAYERERHAASFDLAAFVHREFSVPVIAASDYHTAPGETVRNHID